MQLFKTAHISEKSHSRKPKRILLFIFLLLFLTGALYVTIGYIDGQRIEISHYAIEAPSESPVRILQISDLHCAEFGNNNSNLISKISSLNPDIIFITGDMLNADNSDIHVALQLVKTLVTIAPVYYSYGNHETAWESSFNTNLRAELELLGAVVLDKNYVDIDLKGLPVRIGGYMGYYRSWGMLTTDSDQITQSIAFADAFENTQRYRILLNHIPTAWVDWNHGDDYDVDLVFSGHYHGGLIRIPILDQGVYAPYVGLFPKNTKGITHMKKATCVQTAGLGSQYNIPRLFNPSEVVVVDINPRR